MKTAPDPLGVSDAPLRIEMPTSEFLAKRAAAEKAFQRAADPFAGLGDGAGEPVYSFSMFKFAPQSRQRAEDDPFDAPRVNGQAIKLAPQQRSSDMFEAFGPTPGTHSDEGEYGTFRKGARRFKVGDTVRCNGHGDHLFEIVKLMPTGSFRCEQMDNRGISVITSALSAA